MNEQISLENIYEKIYKTNDLSNAVIEINDECNFRCDHCYLGEKTKSFMTLAMFKKIINQLYDLGCLSILITGGEPLLNPHFIEMYTYAKTRGFLVSINTNGSLITDKIISLFNKYNPYAIEISIYGHNKNTYLDFTHVNSYDLVFNNIKKLKDNNINVKLKTVITNKNYHYLDKLIELSDKLNISFRYDYIVFPNIFSTNEKNNERLNTLEIIKIINKDKRSKKHFNDKILKLNYDDNNHVFQCLGGEQSIYIDSNGYINMCVALVNDKYNINDISISMTIDEFKKMKNNMIFEKDNKCKKCSKKSICRYCPARFKLETGSFNKCPDWYCEVADLIIDSYDTFLCDLNDIILPKMFNIVSKNMSNLYKTKITEEDYLIWRKNILDNKSLKTIINYNGELGGYLQYIDFDEENKICICEVEIDEENQGDGKTFKKILNEFLQEHDNKKYDDYIVYGNINKNNKHSQDVFTHLGFNNTENDIYSISFSVLKESIKNNS